MRNPQSPIPNPAQLLDAVAHLRVLFIGDPILDRYVFVRPLGKSTKESVLSVAYQREETYRGGVWAAASHLYDLCAQVEVMHGPVAYINTRFVEVNRKLFTLHRASEIEPTADFDMEAFDLVVVTDFGHGTMNKAAIESVCERARFLAVNTQTNSSNFGFNLISKYPRADFVVIDELEARLAARERDAPIEDVIAALGFDSIVVTLGSRGAIGWQCTDGGVFHREPARADVVVDTMGAGDAFLAVAAPFACAGLPMHDIVRIGNAAGAAKVGVLGHERPLCRADLERALSAQYPAPSAQDKPVTSHSSHVT